MSHSYSETHAVNRDVIVRHPAATSAGPANLHVFSRQEVSPLDLPPALVFRVEDQTAEPPLVQWLTDPVALSRFCQHHPQANVQVMGTDHLAHRQ
jgi:hypothetical protein